LPERADDAANPADDLDRARRPAPPHRPSVFMWLEARDTPLAAEWLELFRVAPFGALGLATVSAVSIATTIPLVWFAYALM
jgi:hypothetical protein